MRWMKCSVIAKSGTSLLLDIKKRIAMTLSGLLDMQVNVGWLGRVKVPEEGV
jgi:hypothetical protein